MMLFTLPAPGGYQTAMASINMMDTNKVAGPLNQKRRFLRNSK
jgi:hypothetical protein